MKEPSPCFLFWAKDWLAEPAVCGLTLEEQGAYVRLLCAQWMDGYVRSDPEYLARFLGVTKENAVQLRSALFSFFEEDKDGRWRQKRLERVRVEGRSYTDQKRAAGVKSGEARRLKGVNRRRTNGERDANES